MAHDTVEAVDVSTATTTTPEAPTEQTTVSSSATDHQDDHNTVETTMEAEGISTTPSPAEVLVVQMTAPSPSEDLEDDNGMANSTADVKGDASQIPSSPSAAPFKQTSEPAPAKEQKDDGKTAESWAEAADKSPETSSTPTAPTAPVTAAPPTTTPDSKPPQKKTFDSLSEELKGLILSYIIRPSDLKNVFLVCKLFHRLAVKYLYHDISLDLGLPSDNRIVSLLNNENIGLPYVRRLCLYFARAEEPDNLDQQATLAARMLLEFLPENVLEEFRCVEDGNVLGEVGLLMPSSWCPWSPFSADNMLLLYRKQKRLKCLEVMDLDRPILFDLAKQPKLRKGLFKDVRRLALYPEDRSTLQLGGEFVAETSALLEGLVLNANFEGNDRSATISTRDLNDSVTEPGLIMRQTFPHLNPLGSREPLPCLTSLELHKINLRHSEDTWCKVVHFHQITCLRLYHCPATSTLIGHLCRAAHLPKKLAILEIQRRDDRENELLLALDGFLCLVSGIQILFLNLLGVKALPEAAGIVRHGKTLEILNVHACDDYPSPCTPEIADSEELVYSTADFARICSGMRRLQQLSVAWPGRKLISTVSHEWTSYENSVRKLRGLITLHITTWPGVNVLTNPKTLPRSVYETLIRELARSMFEIFYTCRDVGFMPLSSDGEMEREGPAHLNLIAFGINTKIFERRNDPTKQLLYLRSTSLSCDNRPLIHAASVDWTARKYLEPRSEVVDFSLARSAKMPTRKDGEVEPVERRATGWGEHDGQLDDGVW